MGASSLGSRFIPTVEVGVKAATDLVNWVVGEYCVDPHIQDQVRFDYIVHLNFETTNYAYPYVDRSSF